MFSFLKQKLKSALSIFSKKAEEAPKVEEAIEKKDTTQEAISPLPAKPGPSYSPPRPPPIVKPALVASVPPLEKPPSPSEKQPRPLQKTPPAPLKKQEAPSVSKKETSPSLPTSLTSPKKATSQPHATTLPTYATPPLQKTTTTPEKKEELQKEKTLLSPPTPLPQQKIKPPPPLIMEEKGISPLPPTLQQPVIPPPLLPGPQPEQKGFLSRIFGRKEEPSEKEPSPKQEKTLEPSTIKEEATGFLGRITQAITTTRINATQFEELFSELELAMLENNVAVEVIDKIKHDISERVVDKPIQRGSVQLTITGALKDSVCGLFTAKPIDVPHAASSKKPYIICLFGINGSGKTTTIAKLAHAFLDRGLEPVIAAADTFRAAAIDQLEEHAQRLGVKVVKHDYGSDAAAVAFDAIKHAQSKGKDVVLIDTAGRMQTNANLMDEMKKIIRVAKPDLKIFIGESIAGNDCIEQAKTFNDAVGIDGIILSKADVDEKGGAALSVSYVTGKPILYLGVGQEYKDLKEFSPKIIVEQLGL